MAKAPAQASGVFVVDVSGLNLPARQLKAIEKAINATVQKQVAGIDLRGVGTLIPRRPEWYGIVIRPRVPQLAGR